MTKKTVKKYSADYKLLIPEAAMELSEEIGWSHVSMAELAQKCNLSMAELYDYVEDKTDILVLLGRIIDRKTLQAVGDDIDLSESARDRLFDVLMERFDVLNEYRGGVLQVLESFCFDPKQAVISFPHLARSMGWMLEAAGIDTKGMRGAIKVAGLTALYLKALKAWKDDESPDLSKVMATLDKDLGYIERAADAFAF